MAQAQTLADSPFASITGIVRVNGTPTAAMTVALFTNGTMDYQAATTDSSGRYSFTNIEPGTLVIRVIPRQHSGVFRGQVSAFTAERGQKLTRDISVEEGGLISGKVTDENKEPLKDIMVRALAAEYAYGAIRYTTAGRTTTNAKGDYVFPLPPGRQYVILVADSLPYSGDISTAPADPKDRKPVLMPTYFPVAESIDDAMPVTVDAVAGREFVDIRMKHVPSRCIEGLIRIPDVGLEEQPGLGFEIGENDPPIWTVNTPAFPSQASAPGEGGKFRECDLHRGNYWIKTNSVDDPAKFHGIEYITIGDKDITEIATGPTPQFQVEGMVVWDGKPPEDAPPVELKVELISTIGELGKTDVSPSGPLPLDFSLPVSNHSFVVQVSKIPDSTYLKDVTYAGRSILNEVFQPGSGPAADGLRIILGRDGSRVSVRASDKDGNPVAGANVAIIPATAFTEAAAASAMITGQTNSNGTWQSALIAPGRYYVIATTSPVNRYPDAFGKLWRTKSTSNVVELEPNTTAQIIRVPGAIE